MPISPPRPSSASRRGDENAVLEWHSEGFMTIDDKTRIELEAAVFRRLVDHLRSRTDVQNIDMMDLAGFCRNCLASWMFAEAETMGLGEVIRAIPIVEPSAAHVIGLLMPEREAMTPLGAALMEEALRIAPALDGKHD